ncbi:MAG: DMT family transporter [Candidatus Glassbacteria bacterium]|nr:DMT family transporter [Candidatus Glassbacteria bacterium]
MRKLVRAETGALRKFPVIVAICCWVAAVLFVKYFSLVMDVHTQNFFRYLGASLFLALVLKVAYPGCFRRYRRKAHIYLMLGAMMTSFQLCWVHALYLVDPAFVSLLSKVSTPLITVAAFLFYREERAVIRSPRFLTGFFMGLAGVAGIVAGISNFEVGLLHSQKTGIALIVAGAVIWSVYVNMVKHVVREENPLVAFSFTCMSATAILFPIMLVWGKPSTLLGGSAQMIVLLVVSGIIGLAGANSSYFLSIKRIGLAPSANLVLINPFLTAVASYLVFGERLTAVQWVFGSILVAGCALVISVRPTEPDEAERL